MTYQILFIGAPGSGKGTQCARLKDQLQVPHLSTGELLRRGIAEKWDACLEAKQYMDSGALVPDMLMIAIFQERLSAEDCRSGFILDGFPRTLPQAESLDVMLQDIALPLKSVFYLVVTDQLIIERLTGRLTCSQPTCGAIYHIKTAPPKASGVCDICGSPLKQRSDDRPEVLAERLKVYKQSTAPLIDYYKKRGILFEIDGAGSQEEIHAAISQKLQQLTGSHPGGR